jgi:hypothetical protein
MALSGEDLARISAADRDPQYRTVSRRLRNMYEAAPDEVKQAGHDWYPKVNKAVTSAVSGTSKSVRAGAGVVAAVSPNMDWERDNIAAFDELSSLKGRQWDVIHESANQPKIIGANGKPVKPKRTQAAADILQGMGLSKAPDSNLIKAHRIWHGGEDFENVLDRHTAPKTNSFARNIADPSTSRDVTVDGRHADIVVDSMRPWNNSGVSNRGINSANNVRGGSTRYENYEAQTARVADSLEVPPHALQATVWEMGKSVERGFNPDRKQGDMRRGQSYSGRLSEFTSGRS